MKTIEKYDIFEIQLPGKIETLTLDGCGVFINQENEEMASAFADGYGGLKVRFMPQHTGRWKYRINLGSEKLEGSFECVENTGVNHGPVRVLGDHFTYADGTPYIPIGTTCYAWIHQTKALMDQTLDTLSKSPFNKVRMCVFPKAFPYNHNDPDCYPFKKDARGEWDVNQPDPVFWDKLDAQIANLSKLGIEADLILFHPYDRWGFSKMSQEASLAYVKYCVARLGAHRNIWWSLANEYDDLEKKTLKDWDEYGMLIMKRDAYKHLISVHNIITPYPKRPWMTHCSIQSGEIDKVIEWKKAYEIPVIIDECGYEGNLPYDWGNLTAFEMVHRFWWAICRGGFCTHGETFHRDDEVLWWAKGGALYGESAARIAFLKTLLYQLGSWKAVIFDPEAGPEDVKNRMQRLIEHASIERRERFIADISPKKIEGKGFSLTYFGRTRPAYTDLSLNPQKRFKAEIINIWEMTRNLAAEGITGKLRLGLPAQEGIALFVTELN